MPAWSWRTHAPDWSSPGAPGGRSVRPRRVRRRVGDRHPRVRVPGRRPAQLRRLLRRPSDDGHGLRARPPGHGHHGAVRHAAPGLRARHRHRDGQRRARWHEALAQGRERHVLLLRPPQRLRRGPHRRRRWSRPATSSGSWATPATRRAARRTCTSRSIPTAAWRSTPTPLLQVVDELSQQAKARER